MLWESFGADWVRDITQELEIADQRVFGAAFGDLPDLTQADPARDIVFTWNGTTSGVRVPNGEWISDTREGLTICDATSAAFAMDLPWDKLDVTTWSWQKVLGGEGAHGMIVMSPRAIARLTDHVPSWPVPKLYRMVTQGVATEGLFVGETINTPSMLAVEDAIDGLRWAQEVGGLAALKARCEANLSQAVEWVSRNGWCDFLAGSHEIRSPTSICFKIVDPYFAASPLLQSTLASLVAARLAEEKVAFDVAAYRTAPPGFRLWGGATVDSSDLALAFEWLTWSYHEVRKVMTR